MTSQPNLSYEERELAAAEVLVGMVVRPTEGWTDRYFSPTDVVAAILQAAGLPDLLQELDRLQIVERAVLHCDEALKQRDERIGELEEALLGATVWRNGLALERGIRLQDAIKARSTLQQNTPKEFK